MFIKSTGFTAGSSVPYIDAAAVYNEEDGCLSCFIVNRDIESQRELEMVLEHFNPLAIDQKFIMQHRDSKAGNSAELPEEVIPAVSKVFSLQGNVLHGGLLFRKKQGTSPSYLLKGPPYTSAETLYKHIQKRNY
ncbi:hypothetical protein [Oceanispirochaeta sp.]|uniref:hypothetical protein n=1 Tax=Oceanispirochaeta sp. TaxID=2035350 RepID=UPI00261966D7|nr:hypothetical protein [Oceanispirochaeta sp.]MDA3957095.1 hypothetical protein [Oceanispirochaeta sp.]